MIWTLLIIFDINYFATRLEIYHLHSNSNVRYIYIYIYIYIYSFCLAPTLLFTSRRHSNSNVRCIYLYIKIYIHFVGAYFIYFLICMVLFC